MNAPAITIIAQIGLYLTLVTLVAKLLRLFIGHNTEQRWKASIEQLWERIEESPPEKLALRPLQVVSELCKNLFGGAPFSSIALKRCTIFVPPILLMTLAFIGMTSGTILGFAIPPWESHDFQISLLKSFAENEKLSQANAGFHIQDNAKFLSGFGNSTFRVLYSIYSLSVIFLGTSFTTFISFGVGRLILSELISAKSTILLFLVLVSHFCICIGLFILTSILFFFGINFGAWPCVPLIFGLAQIHSLAPILVIPGSAALGMSLSGPWFRVVLFFTLSPVLTIGFVLLCSALGFPFRRVFKSALINVVIRSLDSDQGVFLFYVYGLVLLSAILATISTIWTS